MELSVVIPFYNEERNVTSVLTDIIKALDNNNIDYELIAVDNGSKDKTSFLIDEVIRTNNNVRKVTVRKNQGYGWGILNGLQAAKGELIGWMDGDAQIGVNYLYNLYSLAQKKGDGLFKIKRVNRHDGFKRKLLSKGYNLMMNVLFGINSIDINGCPKLFKRNFFNKLDLKSKDWFLDSELMIGAKRHRLKIYELPAVFDKRNEGESSVKLSTSLEFFKNIIKTFFKN